MGACVNSNHAIPNPPDDPSDNAALLKSSSGTAAGSIINYSSAGSETGIAGVSPYKTLILIYPNPVSNIVTLTNVKSGVITISDISGRVIETITATKENTSLNTSHYKAGIYFYQVKRNNEITLGKFIKN